MKRLLLLLPLLLVASPSWGQAPTPSEKIAAVIKTIPQFNASWKIMLLNEAQWTVLKSISSNNVGKGDVASTSLVEHVTVLRESFVLDAKPELLKHVLWHEAGHIACQCGAEELAEQFAREHL